MNKNLLDAARVARDLCLDAYGNAFDGQEERSMRYLILAVKQLGSIVEAMENMPSHTRTFFLADETKKIREKTHVDYRLFPTYDEALRPAAAE